MIPPFAPELDELPDDLLARLLNALEVPEDLRTNAASMLRSLFDIARVEHWLETRLKPVRNELKDLAKVAKAFRAKLSNLSDGARVCLGLTAIHRDLRRVAGEEACRYEKRIKRGMVGLDDEMGEMGRIRYEQLCSEIE